MTDSGPARPIPAAHGRIALNGLPTADELAWWKRESRRYMWRSLARSCGAAAVVSVFRSAIIMRHMAHVGPRTVVLAIANSAIYGVAIGPFLFAGAWFLWRGQHRDRALRNKRLRDVLLAPAAAPPTDPPT